MDTSDNQENDNENKLFTLRKKYVAPPISPEQTMAPISSSADFVRNTINNGPLPRGQEQISTFEKIPNLLETLENMPTTMSKTPFTVSNKEKLAQEYPTNRDNIPTFIPRSRDEIEQNRFIDKGAAYGSAALDSATLGVKPLIQKKLEVRQKLSSFLYCFF